MRFLFLLILGFFSIAEPALVRAEYLQGTVVRIDRAKGEVEIVVSKEGQCHLGADSHPPAQESSRQLEKQRRIIVKAAWFPRCLSEGTEVYARGEFAAKGRDLFEAEDVFPCRSRGGHDPTGVRSRFHRHRRDMRPQSAGDRDE